MTNNTQLPAEVLEKIHEDTNILYDQLDIAAKEVDSYDFGLPQFDRQTEPIRNLLTEYATKLHQAQQEIERRNKLLESNHKLSMRLNMIGCSEAEQEESWQDYKRRNNL